MKTEPAHDGFKLSYNVTVRRHPAGVVPTLLAQRAAGQHDAAHRLIEQGEVVVRDHNIVVDSTNRGFDLIRQWLISAITGSITYLGPAWGEMGTSSTAPATTDTGLGASQARGSISYAANNGSGAAAALQFYFADANLPNLTYHEFGTFCGGTSSIGTGGLFNHILFTTAYTKTTGNDTTVEVDFTLTN